VALGSARHLGISFREDDYEMRVGTILCLSHQELVPGGRSSVSFLLLFHLSLIY
jgi:hypothetical protein